MTDEFLRVESMVKELEELIKQIAFALNSTPEHILDIIDDWSNKLADYEDKNEWIPVGERLPEDENYVMVYGKYLCTYDWNKGIAIASHYKGIPQWSTVDDIFYHGDGYKTITHWRPLLEPPEPLEVES
jgi:hypothetical protein